jgi:alkaline phosphatase
MAVFFTKVGFFNNLTVICRQILDAGYPTLDFRYPTIQFFRGIFANKYFFMLLIKPFQMLRISSLLILSGFSFFITEAQQTKSLPNPKNIIILIGDGMGYNHIKATEYYFAKGQQEYETFPVRLAMSHYPAIIVKNNTGNHGSNPEITGYNPVLAWKDTAYLKKDVTESAAAATALSTGF